MIRVRNTTDQYETIETRFSRAYNITHPFICAGMASVCDTTDLCLAVCEAGGIGCLAGSFLSPSTLNTRIEKIKKATLNPFHVNFLTPFPHDARIDVCIALKVPIVSFHWGTPSMDMVKNLQAANIAVWVQVGSPQAASDAMAAGVDGIIAQGNEAGGHNYNGVSLLALLPAIRDIVGPEILVFAAGGIADGRTAALALAGGADGIWVGTRLVASNESNAHADYKQRLVQAVGEDTVITSVFGPKNPTFNPVRVIRNNLVNDWHGKVSQISQNRKSMPSIGKTVSEGEMVDVKLFDCTVPVIETTGDFDKMPMLAGQGVSLINAIEPVQTIITAIMNDAAKSIQQERC